MLMLMIWDKFGGFVGFFFLCEWMQKSVLAALCDACGDIKRAFFKVFFKLST